MVSFKLLTISLAFILASVQSSLAATDKIRSKDSLRKAGLSKESDDQALLKEAKAVFAPLPDSLIDQAQQADLIALGKRLYLEKKLSLNDTISCNSCHRLDHYGVDNQKTSLGHSKKRGGRNSPTVYNAALNFVQFWDGRAKDLEEQALGPLLNPIEHGLPNADAAVMKLREAGYVDAFKKAFPADKDPLTFPNIGKAIGAFEKTLLTPAPFDEFLKGNTNALSKAEKNGMKKFMTLGCISCHDGAGVGGGSFQKLGALEEFPTKDVGRFGVTKDESDKSVFKVPSLRNVTHTAPYFHDGSIKSLEEVIPLMAKHQLGEKVTKEEIKSIKAFLGSLSGKIPKT